MTRIRFEDLPSTNTPRNAENLNKLNNVVISLTEPTTGEEVWIDDTNKKIYTKNDNGNYEEFLQDTNEIYTFNEKRIGTWLGKPVYRRVFVGTINDTEKWRFITDSGDIDKKIDTRGFINQGNSGVIVGIGEALSSEDSNLNYATRVIVVSNNLRLDCDGTKFENSPYEISIDYTKTTD